MFKWNKTRACLIALLMMSTFSQVALPAETIDVITFSRGPCLGSCPIYQVDVYSDGLLIFKGRKFVSFIGVKRIQTNPNLFLSLKTAFKEATKEPIDYLGCENFVTDNPTVEINYLGSASYSEGYHNYGCTGYDGEDRLLRVVKQFQELLPINEWIKKVAPKSPL